MKRIIFFTALLFTVFTFGYSQSEKTDNKVTDPSKSDRNPSIPFLKDSLKLQKQLNQYIDSLNLGSKSLSLKGNVRKFRFKNPADSSNIKRYFIPPSNKYPNPNFNQQKTPQTGPYITRVGPDSMPVYVPGSGYIPTKRSEGKGNMPVKVPDGFKENKDNQPSK